MFRRHADTRNETETLRVRLAEAEEMLRAIQHGEIDALVVEGDGGNQVYTLHSAEEPYRDLVEQMQEGAVVLTNRGDILYANSRFAALVGVALESVVGSRFNRFVSASEETIWKLCWVPATQGAAADYSARIQVPSRSVCRSPRSGRLTASAGT